MTGLPLKNNSCYLLNLPISWPCNTLLTKDKHPKTTKWLIYDKLFPISLEFSTFINLLLVQEEEWETSARYYSLRKNIGNNLIIAWLKKTKLHYLQSNLLQLCNWWLHNGYHNKLRIGSSKSPHIFKVARRKPFISGNSLHKSLANLSIIFVPHPSTVLIYPKNA